MNIKEIDKAIRIRNKLNEMIKIKEDMINNRNAMNDRIKEIESKMFKGDELSMRYLKDIKNDMDNLSNHIENIDQTIKDVEDSLKEYIENNK